MSGTGLLTQHVILTNLASSQLTFVWNPPIIIPTSYHQECPCGWSFDDTGAFTRHKKNCAKGKKCMANALSHAKELYHSKKRRIEGDDKSASSSSKAASSNTVSHTVDDAFSDTGLGILDSLHSSRDTMQLTEAHISSTDQVCNTFCFEFIWPEHIGVIWTYARWGRQYTVVHLQDSSKQPPSSEMFSRHAPGAFLTIASPRCRGLTWIQPTAGDRPFY